MSYKDIFKTSTSSKPNNTTEKQADQPDTPEAPAPAKDTKKAKS